MRLLKEFSTRELIDALSYDFNPLQGLAVQGTGTATPGGNWTLQGPRSARISTVEVAIRAQAKKFLAHPLVVQQLGMSLHLVSFPSCPCHTFPVLFPRESRRRIYQPAYYLWF